MPVTFVVSRANLRDGRWIERAREPLAPGSVRMKIDSYALTSNNITYAAFGDAMNYWSFFPTGDATTGCIPVWGFADVIESACEGISVGERFYGYLPMADEFTVQPGPVKPGGFADTAAHRRELPAVYNQYIRCSADPTYTPAREPHQALLKPLFTTSFLIDDFLADQDFFGARNIVLSSASSKTAYGTAFCLALRRPSVHVIGATSASNLAFTQSLGCYDQVLPYDALESLDASVPAVFVDFSGDAAFRARVHAHWKDRLAYSCSVGGTHWDALGGGKGLEGPRPVLFFAPAQIKKRAADWGPGGLQERLAGAWDGLMQRVDDPVSPWLQVVRGRGPEAIETVYRALLDGRSDPRVGHMLSL